MTEGASPPPSRRRVDERCHECGFAYDLGRAEAAAEEIGALVDELAAALAGPSAQLRRRPGAGTWSLLEYACHVRDVLLVQRERVLTARRVARPAFEPMGREERVEHDGYAEQQPADVARQLTEAARLFGNVLARLPGADWDRVVVYGYPSAAERTLRWVAVHTVHEVRHHLQDVMRQVAPTRTPR